MLFFSRGERQYSFLPPSTSQNASVTTHTTTQRLCGQVKQLTDKQEVSLSPSPSSCPSPREVGVTCRSSARCSAPRASAELLLLPLHIQHPEEESRRKTSLEFRQEEDGST